MFCNKCGTQNNNNSLFCEKCGNRLVNNNNQNINTEMINGQSNMNGQPMYNHQPSMMNNMPIQQQPIVNQNIMNGQQLNNQIMMNNQPPTNIPPQHNNQINNNQKNNSNNLFLFGAIILFVFTLIVILILLIPTKEKEQPINPIVNETSTSRTIMIYMIGSDLESDGGMASLDVKEIENSGFDLTKNNVVIYAGGAKKWENSFQNNAIYELTEAGFTKVNQDNKSSMGNPQTLTNFLDYVDNNYSSDKYSLILWDHGAGPIVGYGIDELYESDSLMLKELEMAFENSSLLSKNKLEFIGFDACLMSSVEVANSVKDYSNYMIASQDLEPGFGWDYTFLSEIKETTKTEEIGKLIIDYMDSYYETLSYYLPEGETFYTTLSLLDLTKLDNLEDDLNNLFVDIDFELSNNGYSKIVSKLTRAKSFGYAGYNQSYDLIDLGGVADELIDEYEEKAKALKESIDDVVIYQKTNVEGASGISIYYPYYTKAYLNQFLTVYNSLDFAKDYTTFINNYSKVLTGQTLYNFNLKSKSPVLSTDSSEISITLEENEVNNYNKADYVIFRDMKDGYYMPVYKSSDVSLKKDKLVANFDKKQLSVVDANGEAGWATMYEYEKGKSYVIYNVPAVIVKTKETMESASVNIQLKVDKKNPNGTIVSVVPAIDVENPNSMKKNIDLEEWDYIQFFNSEYDFYDDNGVYTDNWQSSGTVYLTEVSLEKGYEIEFISLEEEYDYYCMFQVHDTQGNVYSTNLVKID